jgi:hypothetical protein
MTSNIWDEVGEDTELEVKAEELAEEALPEFTSEDVELKDPFEDQEETPVKEDDLTYEPVEDDEEEAYTIVEVLQELCYSHKMLIDVVNKGLADVKKAVNKALAQKPASDKPKKAKRKSRAKAGVPGRPAKKLPKTKVPNKKAKKPAGKPNSSSKTKVKGKGR